MKFKLFSYFFKSSVYFVCFIIFFFKLNAKEEIEHLIPVIINKLHHERPAFTQGLSIVDDQLYESTGLYGQSSLRKINLSTGKIEKKIQLPNNLFAEGLVTFSNYLLHVTWMNQQAFLYNRLTSKLIQIIPYIGEGWGLCLDGESIWMSNGTSLLTKYDKQTFNVLNTLIVKWKNQPVDYLNDLECVGNDLYANIWKTNIIIRINKLTGQVNGVIDCALLLSPKEKSDLKSQEVLNGIAFRPKTGNFLLTGKEWPWIFEVYLMSQKM